MSANSHQFKTSATAPTAYVYPPHFAATFAILRNTTGVSLTYTTDAGATSTAVANGASKIIRPISSTAVVGIKRTDEAGTATNVVLGFGFTVEDLDLIMAEIDAIGTGGGADLGYHAATNSTGNTTVTATASFYTERITFSGSAGTRVIILAVGSNTSGDVIDLSYLLPTTAAIVVETRNATAGGTLLDTITTDNTGDDAFCRCVFNGTSWEKQFVSYPA